MSQTLSGDCLRQNVPHGILRLNVCSESISPQVMAAKRRKRKSKQRFSINEFLSIAARPEILGLLLVLLSVFTLLSLMTGSRGQVTRILDQFAGASGRHGRLGLPLVTGALGLWVVIRAIERMPDLPWQRPAGSGLLLLAYIIAATVLINQDPVASGRRRRRHAHHRHH